MITRREFSNRHSRKPWSFVALRAHAPAEDEMKNATMRNGMGFQARSLRPRSSSGIIRQIFGRVKFPKSDFEWITNAAKTTPSGERQISTLSRGEEIGADGLRHARAPGDAQLFIDRLQMRLDRVFRD